MRSPQTLRLRLDPADMGILLQHSLLSTPPKRRRLHLTHFDTPELAVAKLGLSIDESRILRKTTLVVSQTTEAAHQWSAPTTAGSFDFATLIDDADTAEKLSNLAESLTPIYRVNSSQRQWSVEIRSTKVDVILEEGTVMAGDESAEDTADRTRTFCEIELQLNQGPPAALYGVARLLSRQLRLHPLVDSPTTRALALHLGTAPGPLKARRVRIDPKDTVVGVFKHVAWLCINQLQGNESGVFSPNNVEFIHQARVALRRLRTALRLFANELPEGFSEKWSQAWRDVGEQLGNARNWDVFCSDFLPALSVDLGAHPDFLHLTEFAHAERHKAHAATQEWLRGRHYSLTMIAFCEALLALPDRKMGRIDGFANKALKKRYKRFRHGAEIAHTLSGEERHEVRIDLKKLRYALDFFESLYPQKQLQPFLAGLAETQELLGHMNDLVTAEALLALRPGNPFDLPVGWAKGRMGAYLETLPAALKPVLNAKTPW